MDHDPTHPFRHLAALLAEREKKTDLAQSSSVCRTRSDAHRPTRPTPLSRTTAQHSERLSDDDRRLFLRAMQTIQPVVKDADQRRETGTKPRTSPNSPSALDYSALRSMAPVTPPEAADKNLADKQRTQTTMDADQTLFMHLTADGSAQTDQDDKESLAFAKAMRGVEPITHKGRAVVPAVSPGPEAPAKDPAQALQDVLDGKVEFALHNTGEFMEGWVVGVDPLVMGRLRAGQYSPEAHLDLHGMNAEQALGALTWFMKNAYQRGFRNVVVVTGRGKNSPDGLGVLRPLLQHWLSHDPFKRVVLAFCTARPHDGGPGAVYVLLRKYKKSRGKIVWDHIPLDEDFASR